MILRRVPALLLVADIALASSDPHAHAADQAHPIPWATLAISTVNLVLFLLLMRRAQPAITGWLRDRRDRIVEELERASRAQADAERMRADWEARLAALPAELEALRARAREDIERERDQVLAAAHKIAETIRTDARRVAEQEGRQARELLRNEAARQALGIATRLASETLTPADQARFVADFVGKVNP